MMRWLVTGGALAVAVFSLIVAWISQNHYAAVRHELDQHLGLISQIVATEQAQGKVDDAIIHSQKTVFQVLQGKVPSSRSLASLNR